MLKAAIYDPYLDTLGGGERYCLTVAEILIKNGYSVDLFWSGNPDLIKKAQERFNLDIDKIKIVPDIFHLSPNKIELVEDTSSIKNITSSSQLKQNPINKAINFINRIKTLRNYDLAFYLSDGSLPFLFSKKNLLHIQVPFTKLPSSPTNKITNSLKLLGYHSIICNSKFTQRFTKKHLPKKTTVLYPPVDIEKFSASSQKENIILSVGRFDNILNAKKQDVLLSAFQKLHAQNKNSNWKLVLAGGSLEDPSRNLYLQHLKQMAHGLPVEFVVSPKFEDLKKLYSISKIYWHAAGYEVNEDESPENTEHFGMTVVEAMASGLVPLVVAKGGLTEIITDEENGYLWHSQSELISKTQLLMASPALLNRFMENSLSSIKKYSKSEFEKEFLSLIS